MYNDPWGFPDGSAVKNLPAVQETWVQSLGQEDLLEKELATHSSILPGKSHGQRNLVGYSPWGRKELETTEWLHSLMINTSITKIEPVNQRARMTDWEETTYTFSSVS